MLALACLCACVSGKGLLYWLGFSPCIQQMLVSSERSAQGMHAGQGVEWEVHN